MVDRFIVLAFGQLQVAASQRISNVLSLLAKVNQARTFASIDICCHLHNIYVIYITLLFTATAKTTVIAVAVNNALLSLA